MQQFDYNQSIHLNAYLKEQNLPYRIHFKNEKRLDIEPLGTCACAGREDQLKQAVKEFFSRENMTIAFTEENIAVVLGKKRVEVVAAVIQSGDKMLATQRGYGEFKDGWEFPGGKMEKGETPEEALKREIREELDVEISVDKYIHTVEYDYPAFHLTMHCYLCTLQNNKFTLLEHKAAKWLTKEQLNTVEWLPADVEVVEKLRMNELQMMKKTGG